MRSGSTFFFSFFFPFLARADAGNPVTPAPHVPFKHSVEAPPYIKDLESKFAAVSMRVVLRGQSCFYHNGICRKLFMSSEAANEMYAANKQVCGFCVPECSCTPCTVGIDSLRLSLRLTTCNGAALEVSPRGTTERALVCRLDCRVQLSSSARVPAPIPAARFAFALVLLLRTYVVFRLPISLRTFGGLLYTQMTTKSSSMVSLCSFSVCLGTFPSSCRYSRLGSAAVIQWWNR